MIKKRLLSFLGAAAITAALTFAVVSLSPSNGFTSGTMQEGLCYEATGVAPDAIVASLNGNGASADLVAFYRLHFLQMGAVDFKNKDFTGQFCQQISVAAVF